MELASHLVERDTHAVVLRRHVLLSVGVVGGGASEVVGALQGPAMEAALAVDLGKEVAEARLR